MNKIKVSFFICLTVIFFCLNIGVAMGQGNTYYVSVLGSDDSGDGSILHPFATIAHALLNVSDGSLILVQPGTYNGRIRLKGTFIDGVTVRSEVPYQARLRNDDTVITCFYGKGITLEGFDIAHTGSGAGALVIQIQDLLGSPGGDDFVSNITIKNNIIHDSYNNDLLKINNGAGLITVDGNMFYNQEGKDEHIDVNSVTNVTVKNNIFFNDFEGSGRANENNTSSFIVVKDSSGDNDENLGSSNINIMKNVFLNWQGSDGTGFVLIGEDGKPFHEADNVLVENNLMIGNSPHLMRSPFGVKGAKNIVFRNNTIVGDMPSRAYAMRINVEGSNPANDNILFYNNIWSDPTGSMGSTGFDSNDFSDTKPEHILNYAINNNLYWNAASSIPEDSAEAINYTDDTNAIFGNPFLANQSDLVIPRWNEHSNAFNDGSVTIRSVFERLVDLYAKTGEGSPAIDSANYNNSPDDDILGNQRGLNVPDIGAYEHVSTKSSNITANILANGSDGAITINSNGTLSITVTLDAGDMEGAGADWWVYVSQSPYGAPYYLSSEDKPWKWRQGFAPTYAGSLFNIIGEYEVYKTGGMSLLSGTYTFVFAIDTLMDGSDDTSEVYSDSVTVYVINP